MLMQELSSVSVAPHRARRAAAALLRTASRALDGLATSLVAEQPWRNPEAKLEFHADAGAPEGALYVDGQWVGNVVGVTRL